MWTEKDDSTYDELKASLLDKIVFCYYALGQTYFDSKIYLDALETFNKACDLKPEAVIYKIRRQVLERINRRMKIRKESSS